KSSISINSIFSFTFVWHTLRWLRKVTYFYIFRKLVNMLNKFFISVVDFIVSFSVFFTKSTP
ncbi:MAG: hypothetical protein CME98_16155, partial [Hyphomonas sp.]|nr:hypothetical protein [Hyphomonas sp.]